MNQLTKMEESVLRRDSEMDTELSDTIFAIDDLKTTYKLMEEKLYNITEATLTVGFCLTFVLYIISTRKITLSKIYYSEQ